MSTNKKNPYEVFQQEAPEIFEGFNGLIKSLVNTKGLDQKTKQLIYLGMKAVILLRTKNPNDVMNRYNIGLRMVSIPFFLFLHHKSVTNKIARSTFWCVVARFRVWDFCLASKNLSEFTYIQVSYHLCKLVFF